MRKILIAVIPILVFVLGQTAWAEFYRYVDEHGNVLYTDDVNQIPKDQRDKTKTYEESYSEPEAVEQTEESAAPEKAKTDVMDAERKELELQKKGLDAEFDQLKQMRTQLDEAKAKAVTPEQIKAYNQQIIEFNTRAKAHEEKLNAYTAQVNDYNQRLKEQMDKFEKQEEE